ncbi:hypothetical protein ACFL4T_02335, partial [candidate division KSB1 bacterium]
NFLIYGIVFLVLALSIVFYSCKDKPLTSQDIVDKCAEAMGGYDIINNIKTLRIKTVYPDHGEIPMEEEIKRPNKSYNPRSFVVFDGKRICLLKGTDYKSDPELADESEWKDGEVVIGYIFPAFFEYPADLLGIEEIEGKKFYKLKIDLPLGAEMTYLIDSETFYPAKAIADFTMNGKKIHGWRDFSNYKEIDGFKYPHSFTYASRNGRQNGWIKSVEINIPMSDDKFKIPDELKK